MGVSNLEIIQEYNHHHQLDIRKDTSHHRRQVLIRRMVEGMFAFLFAYGGLWIGPLDHLDTLVWPHTGILLGILFLRGPRVLWWVALGSFVAAYQTLGHMALSFMIAAWVPISSYLVYKTLMVIAGPLMPLSRRIPLLKALAVMMLLGVFTGFVYFQLFNFLQSTLYPISMLWGVLLSATIGFIVFTPLCLMWDTDIPGKGRPFDITKAIFYGSVLFFNAAYCYVATTQMWLYFGLSLGMVWGAGFFYGQKAAALVGMIHSLFLLSWTELPGSGILMVYPASAVFLQGAFLINQIGVLIYRTSRLEQNFKNFVVRFWQEKQENKKKPGP